MKDVGRKILNGLKNIGIWLAVKAMEYKWFILTFAGGFALGKGWIL